MLSKLRGNNTKGFTLIELMIVIAIIGILAAIAIPNFISYRDKAYCGYAENDAANTFAALSSYFSDPSHVDMPTVAQLTATEDLSLNSGNTATLSDPAGDGSWYQVTVTDGSERCPRGSVFTSYMGSDQAVGGWN